MPARGTWRLGNAGRWLRDPVRRAARRRVLRAPWRWYLAVTLKLIPGLWPWPVRLALRAGGEVTVREFMTLVIFDEIFVERCYAQGPPGDCPVLLDVGANTGLFARWALGEWPGARVHCYEPYPPNLAQLQRALRAEPGVTIHGQAVGAQSGTALLHVHPTNLGGHSLVASLAGDDVVSVQVVDLACALDRLPGGRCDLLKLDCEGAEVEVIEALTPELAARVGALVCELTPGHGEPARLEAQLRGLGYAVTRTGRLLYAGRHD